MPNNYSISTEQQAISTEQQARYGRTIDFLGPESWLRLQGARIAIVGLGGVGSHAALALLRAGVNNLVVVDCDQVSASGLNRHAFATPADVGQPKAEVVRRYLQAITPEAKIEALVDFFHTDTAENILRPPLDFVVDAIDSFTPKVALLHYCVTHNLPVISSMGASARHNPTMLRIGDISETRICPLAKVVRKRLKKLGVERGITCVYSIEEPKMSLPPDDDEDFYRRGRPRRRLPSLSTMPGIFGYTLAGVVIEQLCQ